LRNSLRIFLTTQSDQGSRDCQVGTKVLALVVGFAVVNYALSAALHQEGKDVRGVYVSTS